MKGDELLKLSHEDLALHAIEGWNLASSVTGKLNSALLQIGALRELLEHEVRGCHPCGSDCVPGGVSHCTGCDDRYKAVYSVLGKAEQQSAPMTLCGYCGDPHPLGQSRPCRG